MMATLPRMVRLALRLFVVSLAVWPAAAFAADKDLVEIKLGLTNLLSQVQTLQVQVSTLKGTLDVTTNSLRNEIASVQNGLVTLKTAVEARDAKAVAMSEVPSARQIQFASSLRDLSNAVTQLGGMVADLKAGGGRADYKAEVDRQLSALTARVASLTNALLSAKPSGVDAETKNNIAFLKDNLSRVAGARSGWIDYALLALLVISLGLSGWMFANFRGQLGLAEQKTREALVRFGAQMESRVKTMEGSSLAVQNSAKEITDCLERVESAVHAQLETVTQQLESSQLTELVGGTARTTEQMGRLRAETAELQQFIGDLHRTTEHWIADFEKQTGHTLDQIKSEMHSLDRLLWPAPFMGNGKLGAARERIRARATAGDQTAFALMLGLGQLQLALAARGGDPTPIVESLDRLGTFAYRFWKEEPDSSVEATFENAQAWGADLNKLLTDNNLPLSIRIIMPRASFDMTTMLSEHSVTGTTLRVREPLSWAVVSKGSEQQKVLVTGKVITE